MVIAGSDSGGGAGIQADIKAVAAAGGHACTVITALTAQNTTGVQGVLPVELGFVRQQFVSVREDIGFDAVKTGMLASVELVELVAGLLAQVAVPIVVDPVMVAKGGARLLAPAAVLAVKNLLLPKASLLTPNLDEAEELLGYAVRSSEAMERAARDLAQMGAAAVLVKGGHLNQEPMDVLFDGKETYRFSAPRINTPHTHGTGCSLASALACFLGRNLSLADAVARARQLVRHGIANALPIGHGHGPVHVLGGREMPGGAQHEIS